MYVEDCDFCMRAAQNGYIVADTTNISVNMMPDEIRKSYFRNMHIGMSKVY